MTTHHQIKIERGIPIPPRKTFGQPKKNGGDVGDLKISNSLFFKANGASLKQVQQDLHNRVLALRPRKFATRQMPDKHGNPGVRIWRVA